MKAKQMTGFTVFIIPIEVSKFLFHLRISQIVGKLTTTTTNNFLYALEKGLKQCTVLTYVTVKMKVSKYLGHNILVVYFMLQTIVNQTNEQVNCKICILLIL